MILNQGEYKNYRETMALNLLKLVKHHKENCKSADCGVSLWIMSEIYRELLCRELTEEEIEIFM